RRDDLFASTPRITCDPCIPTDSVRTIATVCVSLCCIFDASHRYEGRQPQAYGEHRASPTHSASEAPTGSPRGFPLQFRRWTYFLRAAAPERSATCARRWVNVALRVSCRGTSAEARGPTRAARGVSIARPDDLRRATPRDV